MMHFNGVHLNQVRTMANRHEYSEQITKPWICGIKCSEVGTTGNKKMSKKIQMNEITAEGITTNVGGLPKTN